MRCEICQKYPNIIKQFRPRGKVSMATRETRYRSKTLEEHIQSDYHKECERLFRLSTVPSGSSVTPTPLKLAMDKANLQMINHVGKLMIQIFYDAKHLNLPAFSWPARYVASAASFAYDSQNRTLPTIPENIPMQYVNPPGHLDLMTTIVNSYFPEFMKKINECWAVSLRVDGSVDLTQIDKIYVLAKIINLDGTSELLFIGIGHQTERKAIGLKKATMEGIEAIIGTENQKSFLRKVSSICTDGTNVNTGDRTSLWVLLDGEMEAIESKIPLIKIWCAAHRAELVWKDTGEKVAQVNKLLSVLSSISSYFHHSGLRTAELEKIGKENGLKVHRLPKIFLVRWTEFSFTLLRGILVSWKALVLYFKRYPNEADCIGFLRYLTTIENLKLIAFIADVLFTYKRFQKKIQSDRMTIISLMSNITSLTKSLERMESFPLVGGFEQNLAKQISTGSNGEKQLKGIELLETESTRRTTTSFAEVRKKILNSIREFLESRFEADDAFVKMIEPFLSFNPTADIEAIHTAIAPDMNLPSLSLQFQDIASDPKVFEGLSLSEIIVKLSKSIESRENFREVITVLARIAACTPHSADVERCISANNRLKVKLRSRIKVETENKYMFIHYNMPDLAEWDPTDAANLFFAEKTRRGRDTSTSAENKSRAQLYFKGVFPEARSLADPDIEQPSDDEELSSTVFEF